MPEFHVSPSQVDTFIGCPRQWAFDKIAGIPRGDNKYALRGTRVHSILERWSLDGTPLDLKDIYAQIAYPALKHIPAPKTPGVTPEQSVTWRSPQGHLWVFIKDLRQDLGAGQIIVYDYKTTSNLDFIKKPEYLRDDDVQAVLYAFHEYTLGALQVSQRWLYLTANKPFRCVPVQLETEKKHNADRFALFSDIADVMIAHRKKGTPPEQFQPKLSRCSAFGGCHYKACGACKLNENQTFEGLFMQSTQPKDVAGFLNSISKIAQGGKPVAQTPIMGATQPPAHQPTVVATPTGVAVDFETDPPIKPAHMPLPIPQGSAVAANIIAGAKSSDTLPWNKPPEPMRKLVPLPSLASARLPWQTQAPVEPPPAAAEEQPFVEPLPLPNETSTAEPSEAPPETPAEPQTKGRGRRKKSETTTEAEEGQTKAATPAAEASASAAVTEREARLFAMICAYRQNPAFAILSSIELVDRAKADVAALEVADV